MANEKKFSLLVVHLYLRKSFNLKLYLNLFGLIKNIMPYLATKASKELPTAEDLNLVEADKTFAIQLKRIDEALDSAALQKAIINQPLIFRISRDMLYTNRSRKARILSGVTQQLRRGYCNKAKNGVYL